MPVIPRIVLPELLDEMDPHHPAAIHSRRDLKRLNRLMGNAYWIARVIKSAKTAPQTIAELGAGDGTFLFSLLRRLHTRNIRPNRALLIDRQPILDSVTRAQFEGLGCSVEFRQGDVFHLHQALRVDALICNLFLHHFEGDRLTRLLSLAESSCNMFIACETRRTSFSAFATHLLRLIGCNHVTRHDAKRSVEAGFIPSELSELWPNRSQWDIYEQPAGPFCHLFVAKRLRSSAGI